MKCVVTILFLVLRIRKSYEENIHSLGESLSFTLKDTAKYPIWVVFDLANRKGTAKFNA